MKAFLCVVLTAAACLAARVETVTVDLTRPQLPFSVSATEATDADLRFLVQSSGSDYAATNWTGLFWYGSTLGGWTVTNWASAVGSMDFTIPSAHMPTNGRYTAILLGAASNRVTEWARGSLTVRANPFADSLPLVWATNLSYYVYSVQALALAGSAYTAGTQALALAKAAVTPQGATNIAAAVAAAGYVPNTRTLTLNGQPGGLGSNLVFTVESGGMNAQAATNIALAVAASVTNAPDRIVNLSESLFLKITASNAVLYAISTQDNTNLLQLSVAEGGLFAPGTSLPRGDYFLPYNEGSQSWDNGNLGGVEHPGWASGVLFLDISSAVIVAPGAYYWYTGDSSFPLSLSVNAEGCGGTATIDYAPQIVTNILKTFASTADLTAALAGYVTPEAASNIAAAVCAAYAPTNNAIYTGTLTLNGSVITQWPAAGSGTSNTIYTAAFVSSTTTVVVNATQSVYRISVTGATAISNVLSALSLDGTRDARWELWANFTVTNPPAWAANIAWDQTPDISVTGLYKFAFSSCCGLKVQARQLYPTRYDWRYAPGGSGVDGTWDYNYASGTGATIYAKGWTYNAYTVAKFPVYINQAFTLYAKQCMASGGDGALDDTAMTVTNVSKRETGLVYAMFPPREFPAYGTAPSMIARVRLVSADTGARLYPPFIRPANELEISAFLAGWRP